MKIRLAFAGFRHGHILSLYRQASGSADFEIVAACEDDPATRSDLASQGMVRLTHSDYRRMLDEVECDAVAVGDYYERRGSISIEALSRGRHVISDKPICTRRSELDRIERLCAERGLKFGCQLDIRDCGSYLRLRELVRSGAIGKVLALATGGQHPLNLGSRPAWYFEPGRHGGTLNDLGIHAFDFIPWLTGLRCVERDSCSSGLELARRSVSALPGRGPVHVAHGQRLRRDR